MKRGWGMSDGRWGTALLRMALILALSLLATVARAQEGAHPGDTLRASVLTFAPGETYWARFGHNAILMENTATGANAVYNYGMFDFFQKNFFLNFARGHMLYRLDVDTLDRTLALYASEGRWVRQQALNLTPQQRLDLAVFLDRNARPDQAQYRYDYFRDNCSTRVRDAIDRVVGGAIAQRLKAEPVPVTYRSEASRLMRPLWPLAVGMDLILGPGADAPISRWEQSFVPDVFSTALATQALHGAPLVSETKLLVADSGRFIAPDSPLPLGGYVWLPGLLLGALLAFSGRRARRWPFALLATPLLLLAGVGGLLMLAAWTLTDHWAMHANALLGWFNPVALLLLAAVWRDRRGLLSARRQPLARFALLAWLLSGVAATAFGGFSQANVWVWTTFWLPIYWGLASGLHRRLA